MKIGLTGAAGFIGSRIVELANRAGHSVVGFSRNAAKPLPGCVETRLFDMDALCDFEGCDGIIHLAGESVAGIWTEEKRSRIMDSRKLGTRHVVNSIFAARQPPSVLVSGSAIGFYGDTGENEADEDAPAGKGFLAQVCQAWENEAARATEKGIRVVFLRSAVVLGKHGALKAMLPAFRSGLGGKLGSGRQWMAWIHIDDEAALALFALENQALDGPVNAAAPAPCRNADFTKALGLALHRPAFLTIPAVVLSSTLGDFSHELLDNRRIIPKRPILHKFPYRFPLLDEALTNILHEK